MVKLIAALIGIASIVVAAHAGGPGQNQTPATSAAPGHPIFIGIKGAVIAFDRANGQEVWRSPLIGRDFVNVVLEDGELVAATHGELFCLDPATGHVRWHIPLKGSGRGLVTIAGNQQTVVTLARRQNEADAADPGIMMMLIGMM